MLRVVVDAIASPDAGGASSATVQMMGYLESYPNVELIAEPKVNSRIVRTWDRLLSSSIFTELAPLVLRKNTHYEIKVKSTNASLVFFLNPTNNARFLNCTNFYTTIWDLGHRELGWLTDFKQHQWNRIKEQQLRNDLYRAKLIFVESEDTADKVSKIYGISRDRIIKIPFIPRKEFMDNKLPKMESSNGYAIYPANFWEHKNHSTLIMAMKLLLDSGKKPLRLVFTGKDSGYEEKIRQLVSKYNLEKLVDFKNFVSLDELIDLYLGARLTVFPSYLGPTNIPPLESIVLGTPAFVSPQAMSAKEVKDMCGISYVPPDEIQSWARVIDDNFLPKPFEARRNIEVLRGINIQNEQKIQSLLRNENRDLL